MPPECKYFGICALPSFGTYKEEYCALHDPNFNKDKNNFAALLQQYIDSGKSDFRYMTFPEGLSNFNGRTFSSLVDFTGAVFVSVLAMQEVRLSQGLSVETKTISGIDLSRAIIDGPVNLAADDISTLALENATVSGPFQFSAANVGNILAKEARFLDTTNIQIGNGCDSLRFDGATFAKGLIVRTPSFKAINFNHAKRVGNFVIKAETGDEILANDAKFEGDIKIQVKKLGNTLNLATSSFEGNVTIEGYVQNLSLTEATIHEQLRIERSEISNPRYMFFSTKFAPTSELHLDGTQFKDDLEIIGRPPPKSIYLNAARVTGKLTIHSELGKRRIDVVADKNSPSLGRDVSLVNVDLSRFMLLGNFIDKIEIGNIKWAKRLGRSILYDEVAMRTEGRSALWGNLKEAYQVLKEKYRQMGDNATAGDFHYGEMEARRRESSWRARTISPEFFYWAFSGYGIGYIRAFLILILFIAGFGAWYYFYGGISLEGDLEKALLFSFQTAVLLRPPRPYAFSRIGEWVQAVESILVPVQATLFVLALRMRLKR
jgi:hypothetical protein